MSQIFLSAQHAQTFDAEAIGRSATWFKNLAAEIIAQITAMGQAKIAELVANPAELTALLTTAMTTCGLGAYAALIVPIIEPMILAALKALLPVPAPAPVKA